MNEHKLFMELDEIHYRYERLTSLIGLMQIMAAETIEVAGIPQKSLSDALYEIELGMEENNNCLRGLFQKKGGAA
ncbi:MAG: hypothetical protein HFH72_06645 [Lachnospiraceae bacterium]|nr:hypothetical protein [Lachnospiraceae bacterium]